MTPPDGVRVLLAEDEEHLGNILRAFLVGRGHQVTIVRDGRAALQALRMGGHDVALLDVVMPELDGLAVLRAVQELPYAAQIVVTTGNGTPDSALAALQLGAYDYLPKPYRMAEVDAIVRRASEKGRLARENRSLRMRLAMADADAPFVTVHAPLVATREAVERAGRGDVALVIAGEPGTGRRALARHAHALSPRAAVPLVSLAPAAPDRLHAALDAAAGGALLVEELDRLQVTEPGPAFDRLGAEERGTRLHATVGAPTSDDWLERLVARVPALAGAAAVVLPPLRHRLADVWPLALHFLERAAPGAELDADAREPLERYPWPGNVAELRGVVELAAMRRSSGAVCASHLAVPPLAGTPA